MSTKGSQTSGENVLGEAVNSLVEGNKVFDRYTLMKLVGAGRTSAVWKAWDERVGRDVALKFLPSMLRPDASALATLKSEVKKLQDIKHPQLVNIDNVENEGPLVAIVADYVDGQTLAQLREAKSDQVFSPAELSDWFQQVCTVLDHGHKEGMLPHGAMKPGNIVVDQRGTVRVTDYGLERIVNEFVARTTDVKDAGRDLRYLSPQMAGGEPVTYLDDIYAIGSTIYELLTSKPPFYTGDIKLQLLQKNPPPMTHRRKELRVIGEPISRVWEETVAACLAKDPAQRPQSIEELVNRLELKRPSSAPPVEVAPATPPPASNTPVMIAVMVVFFIVVGAVAVVLGKKKKPEMAQVPPPTQGGLSEDAMKELEEKKRQAEKNAADAAKLVEDAKKKAKELEAAAKKAAEEAAKKAKADEERLRAEAADLAAKRKKAEEDAARIKAEAEEQAKKLAQAASTDPTAKKAQEELAAKLKKAEEDAAKLRAEAEKAKMDAERRIAEAKKKAEQDAAKNSAAVAAAQKMAQDAENERRRKQAILDQQERDRQLIMAKMEQERREKEAAEAKKKAEEKAKADAARAAADFAKRQFSPDKKVWYNSLGMKFVPVGRTHVCVFETRVSDFDAFVKATRYDAGKGWSSPGFSQQMSHPVVNVNWRDAQEFCKWLTTKEQGEKIIGNRRYRLLTDAEWSEAVGLRGESGATPTEKDGKVKGVFPWGNTWPPAVSAGNYPDSLSYDRFEKTAPAGSFKANALGLHDLGGNAWEWCEDWSDGSQKTRVLRGGSYLMNLPAALFSSYRRHMAPEERSNDVGFRVVLSE